VKAERERERERENECVCMYVCMWVFCSCHAERMKAQLLKPEVRDRIKYLSSEQFGVDEKKRPGAEDVPQASFRKLNVD